MASVSFAPATYLRAKKWTIGLGVIGNVVRTIESKKLMESSRVAESWRSPGRRFHRRLRG
jgi:hypothetical protein